MSCTACGSPLVLGARSCRACGSLVSLGSPSRAPGTPVHETVPPHLTLEVGERCRPDAPCGAHHDLGGFFVAATSIRETVCGESIAGLETTGEQHVFEATAPGGGRIHVAWVEWCHGEREVRRTRRFETPWRLDRRLGDQRLEVEAWGDGHLWVELEQARLEDGTHAATYRASETELDGGAHTCVRCALLGAGATAVGTRQEVLGALDERRHYLCATFPRDALRVAIAAFLLVRVAPLLHRVRARRA